MLNKICDEVTLTKINAFKRVTYTMVSANPEDDVNGWMEQWAKHSGLLQCNPDACLIGWDYPFLSDKQREQGLRGYEAAYLIPDDFVVKNEFLKIKQQPSTTYAVLSLKEPFIQPFDAIPQTYQKILAYLKKQGIKVSYDEQYVSCFEYLFKEKGITYMNVYIHVGESNE